MLQSYLQYLQLILPLDILCISKGFDDHLSEFRVGFKLFCPLQNYFVFILSGNPVTFPDLLGKARPKAALTFNLFIKS